MSGWKNAVGQYVTATHIHFTGLILRPLVSENNVLFISIVIDIWSDQSFQTDPDLPPGWKKIKDMAGIYYWHIPTGTTQWERPATHPAPPVQTDNQAQSDHTDFTPRKHSLGSLSPSPTPDQEVRNYRARSHTHTRACQLTQKAFLSNICVSM